MCFFYSRGFFTVLDILGNALVMYLIITTTRLHGKTNWFVLSLALADLCVGLTYFPLLFISIFFDHTGGLIQNQPYLFIFLISKLMCLDSRQVSYHYDAFKIHRIHDKEAISHIAGFSLDRTFNSLYNTFNFHLF